MSCQEPPKACGGASRETQYCSRSPTDRISTSTTKELVILEGQDHTFSDKAKIFKMVHDWFEKYV